MCARALFAYYLHIPALPGAGRDAADIPAFDIRAVSDAEFAAHLQQSATASARRVGERIRTLRESRGLSVEETATRAGVVEHVLRRIEQGKHGVDVSMTEKILTAIGYALEDILPEEQAALVQ